MDKVPAGSMKWYHASTKEHPRPADRVYAEGETPDAGFAAIDMDPTGFGVTFYNAELHKQYQTPWIGARSAALIEQARARSSE